jgi:hypothetical protein
MVKTKSEGGFKIGNVTKRVLSEFHAGSTILSSFNDSEEDSLGSNC